MTRAEYDQVAKDLYAVAEFIVLHPEQYDQDVAFNKSCGCIAAHLMDQPAPRYFEINDNANMQIWWNEVDKKLGCKQPHLPWLVLAAEDWPGDLRDLYAQAQPKSLQRALVGRAAIMRYLKELLAKVEVGVHT